MSQIDHHIRRIAVAALAVAAVALSGCATNYSGAERLERWEPGETKDLMLVRGVHELNPAHFKSECTDKKLSADLSKVLSQDALPFFVNEVCPNFAQWKRFSGFVKSDFRKGPITGAGFIPPGMKIEVDDIIEVSQALASTGLGTRPALAVRVIRKNALVKRDPTCYWDGQSGRLDGFATGGVVCPAEGWDWREQKWAKK